MEAINVLSLFDGISCARVALERAGIKVNKYFASEIDKYALQVSKNNYPDIIQLGDVRNITKESVEEIDLLIGGSPCQDLSIAKKNRKGLSGERSGLFWEYVRILKELKPKYFILENVNSMPREAKQVITETLGVEPVMINASLVSAQNRKRLFWTNIQGITQPIDKGILLKDIIETGITDKDKSYAIDANYYKGANLETYKNKCKRQLIYDTDDSKPSIGQAKRRYGINGKCCPLNNWSPTIKIGQIGKGGQGDRIYSVEGKSTALSANGGGRVAKTGLYAVALRNRGEGKKPELGGNKSNAITTVQTDSMILQDHIIRKLTPIECERLQSLPDNYTQGISNTQRYKCLGNAFNTEVITHILRSMK